MPRGSRYVLEHLRSLARLQAQDLACLVAGGDGATQFLGQADDLLDELAVALGQYTL